MFTSILLLAVVFIAGLMTTNLTTKKIFAWFLSLSFKNPSAVVLTNKTKVGGSANIEKKSIACSNRDELKRVFATFDKNGDGNITKQELKESLKNIGMPMEEKDIKDLIKTIDTNQDGLIDLDEFCESFASLFGKANDLDHQTTKGSEGKEANDEGTYYLEEDNDRDLKEAFGVFDGDKDGLITVGELGLVLSSMGFRQGNRLDECSKMIKNVDMDGDGMVNFDEFKRMMKRGHRFVPVA